MRIRKKHTNMNTKVKLIYWTRRNFYFRSNDLQFPQDVKDGDSPGYKTGFNGLLSQEIPQLQEYTDNKNYNSHTICRLDSDLALSFEYFRVYSIIQKDIGTYKCTL